MRDDDVQELEPDQQVADLLSTGRDVLAEALDVARGTFGPTVQGVSVNETLVDLYRETDAAINAARNALNALRALSSPEIRQAATPPPRKDLGRPVRAPRKT